MTNDDDDKNHFVEWRGMVSCGVDLRWAAVKYRRNNEQDDNDDDDVS